MDSEDVAPFSFDFDEFNRGHIPGVGPVLDTDLRGMGTRARVPSEQPGDDTEPTQSKGKGKRKRAYRPVLARPVRTRRPSPDSAADAPAFSTGAYDYLLDPATRHAYDWPESSPPEDAEASDDERGIVVPIGISEAMQDLADEEDVSVSEDELEEEEARTDEESCFMCMYGNRRYDKVACPKANKLAELFEENFGSATSTKALSAIMYKYYYSEIYLQGLEAGKEYPRWSKAGVYRHITEHMSTEPRVWTLLTIERLQRMSKLMDQFLLEEDCKTGVRRINAQLVNAQLRTISLTQQLYRSKVKDCVGFNETLKIDPKNVGRLWHISNVALDGG